MRIRFGSVAPGWRSRPPVWRLPLIAFIALFVAVAFIGANASADFSNGSAGGIGFRGADQSLLEPLAVGPIGQSLAGVTLAPDLAPMTATASASSVTYSCVNGAIEKEIVVIVQGHPRITWQVFCSGSSSTASTICGSSCVIQAVAGTNYVFSSWSTSGSVSVSSTSQSIVTLSVSGGGTVTAHMASHICPSFGGVTLNVAITSGSTSYGLSWSVSGTSTSTETVTYGILGSSSTTTVTVTSPSVSFGALPALSIYSVKITATGTGCQSVKDTSFYTQSGGGNFCGTSAMKISDVAAVAQGNPGYWISYFDVLSWTDAPIGYAGESTASYLYWGTSPSSETNSVSMGTGTETSIDTTSGTYYFTIYLDDSCFTDTSYSGSFVAGSEPDVYGGISWNIGGLTDGCGDSIPNFEGSINISESSIILPGNSVPYSLFALGPTVSSSVSGPPPAFDLCLLSDGSTNGATISSISVGCHVDNAIPSELYTWEPSVSFGLFNEYTITLNISVDICANGTDYAYLGIGTTVYLDWNQIIDSIYPFLLD
jgi:hypothetical protein